MTEWRDHPAVQCAIQTAARAKRVPARAIKVVAVEEREWPSAALGLPEPGMVYAQMIVAGYRVRLRGPHGETWVLHTDGGHRARVAEG